MDELKTEDVFGSRVVKILNYQIDSKAKEMVMWQHWIQSQMEQAAKPQLIKPTISTRTHEEVHVKGRRDRSKRNEWPLLYHNLDLKRIAEVMMDCVRLEKEIGDLQRIKLRLANDYDFTHGDNELQRLIFGDEPLPEKLIEDENDSKK